MGVDTRVKRLYFTLFLAQMLYSLHAASAKYDVGRGQTQDQQGEDLLVGGPGRGRVVVRNALHWEKRLRLGHHERLLVVVVIVVIVVVVEGRNCAGAV